MPPAMPPTTQRQLKFHRFDPDDRKDQLVRAALRCLMAEGHTGLSVRRIAKEAEVSQGLVNHHFGSVDALVGRAYEILASELLQSLEEGILAAPQTAAGRLDALITGTFSSKVLDPELLSAWIVFWSLVRHSAEIDEIHTNTYQTYVAMLRSLISDLITAENLQVRDLRLASIGLSALLDGLWLEGCLNSHIFTADDAINICRGWVEGLRRGVFA
ncbi:TetR/AcrR family transcriptional regulator [Pectobacterium actinidiae]|uniref:TetR/AcrR family transcriptional regulator n=1 Tax=Pectobacterium actinidiae TaxID=1507808 RepID=UPI0037FD7AF0